ncbi:hypothetical protein CCUS01_03515 [Colletotrichum cuscutae]|uniref:Uncharacterized protein n=1 Tax=Colletotrichum cuscutae TaxID=1209917 RepID=A0AAI9Y896_9PEZI|nr:hypothetical protein CCUS01_03515 [Colletotrichum cuscutae]
MGSKRHSSVAYIDDYERELGRAAQSKSARQEDQFVQEARIHKVATGPPVTNNCRTFLFGLMSSSVPVFSAKYRWAHPSPLYFEDLGSLGLQQRNLHEMMVRSNNFSECNICTGRRTPGPTEYRPWLVHGTLSVPRIRRTHFEPFLPHLLTELNSRGTYPKRRIGGVHRIRQIAPKKSSDNGYQYHHDMQKDVETDVKLTLTWRHNQLGHPSNAEKISGTTDASTLENHASRSRGWDVRT